MPNAWTIFLKKNMKNYKKGHETYQQFVKKMSIKYKQEKKPKQKVIKKKQTTTERYDDTDDLMTKAVQYKTKAIYHSSSDKEKEKYKKLYIDTIKKVQQITMANNNYDTYFTDEEKEDIKKTYEDAIKNKKRGNYYPTKNESLKDFGWRVFSGLHMEQINPRVKTWVYKG